MDVCKFCFLILALQISYSLAFLSKKKPPKSKFNAMTLFLETMHLSNFFVRDSDRDNFSKVCVRGHFLNLQGKRCERCPFDHHMPDALHSQIGCYPCQHAKPNSPEKDLVPCTLTADTIIGCKKGYFLQLAAVYDDNLAKCAPCTKCKETSHLPYETRPCGKSVDTLCCPHPDMKAVQKEGELDYECQRSKQTNESFQGVSVTLPASDNNGRPENICSADQFMNKSCGAGQFVNKTCGAGQFVKIKNGTGLKSCETCPDGTFMIKKRHSSLYCHSCQVSGPRDSLMGCISKKELPVIVGCLNHKWICHPANFNKDPSLRACCQCTTCQYVGMECTNTSDTKCCPRPNMTYVYGECHEEKQALADVTVSPILSNLCYMFLGFVVLVCIFLIVCY